MLAYRDHLARDLGMSRRDREVDHDLDIRVVEDDGNIPSGRNVVLRGLLFGSFGEDVANGQHLSVGEAREIFQIGVTDRAGTDYPNPDRTSHDQVRSLSRNSRLARTASSRSV